MNRLPTLEVTVKKRLGAFTLDVSLVAPPGMTMLFGASGSGKTTLLNCVAGLVEPEDGRIAVEGLVLYDAKARSNVSVTKRNVGYVFQDLALFPHLTVEGNIGYGIRDGNPDRIGEVVAAFHLEPTRGRKPKSLSGGEQQRVALARALVTEPRVLLLDEPLSALDPAAKSRIMEDLRRYIERRPIPVLYVTHSREEVFALGERVVALGNGKVVGEGTPREVLTGHRHEAIAEWGGVENIFDGTITALHETQGTMTFSTGAVELEVPLGRTAVGTAARVGVSASDILLAVEEPRGISARNVLAGIVISFDQHDSMISLVVRCHDREFRAHITPGAAKSLALQPTSPVWVIIKTHSLFLITR